MVCLDVLAGRQINKVVVVGICLTVAQLASAYKVLVMVRWCQAACSRVAVADAIAHMQPGHAALPARNSLAM